ncbi:hypothetical protein V6R21_07695 [Limibacter armeniacum]|uniref:hypothetical protein n=1 Tax=Limibacter armeniacum TaxID=466084 RepID=UPI002FE690DA
MSLTDQITNLSALEDTTADVKKAQEATSFMTGATTYNIQLFTQGPSGHEMVIVLEKGGVKKTLTLKKDDNSGAYAAAIKDALMTAIEDAFMAAFDAQYMTCSNAGYMVPTKEEILGQS